MNIENINPVVSVKEITEAFDLWILLDGNGKAIEDVLVLEWMHGNLDNQAWDNKSWLVNLFKTLKKIRKYKPKYQIEILKETLFEDDIAPLDIKEVEAVVTYSQALLKAYKFINKNYLKKS